jgi:hypothetical protein
VGGEGERKVFHGLPPAGKATQNGRFGDPKHTKTRPVPRRDALCPVRQAHRECACLSHQMALRFEALERRHF